MLHNKHKMLIKGLNAENNAENVVEYAGKRGIQQHRPTSGCLHTITRSPPSYSRFPAVFARFFPRAQQKPYYTHDNAKKLAENATMRRKTAFFSVFLLSSCFFCCHLEMSRAYRVPPTPQGLSPPSPSPFPPFPPTFPHISTYPSTRSLSRG